MYILRFINRCRHFSKQVGALTSEEQKKLNSYDYNTQQQAFKKQIANILASYLIPNTYHQYVNFVCFLTSPVHSTVRGGSIMLPS